MTFEAIVEIILAAAPSLIAVISTVVMIIKVVAQFAALKKDVVQCDKEALERLEAEYRADMKKLGEEAQKAVEDIRKATNEQLDYVSGQMQVLLQENYELKKTLNETMTKIDHVRRK